MFTCVFNVSFIDQSDRCTCETENFIFETVHIQRELLWIPIAGPESSPYGQSVRKMNST